jgi:hypothetical protein
LRLELAPSRALAVTIVALHATAAVCVLLVLPSTAGAMLAGCLMALGLAAAWSRALLRSPASVRVLEVSGSQVTLELASGERIACQPAGRRYVSRFMVTLPLRPPARRTLLITGDMLENDAFRRLRIWALWGKLPGVATEQLPA